VSAKYCETTPKYALFSVTARYAARAKLVWYKVGLSVKMAKVINLKKCQFRIIFSAKINKKMILLKIALTTTPSFKIKFLSRNLNK
jgi:hypothetical protein